MNFTTKKDKSYKRLHKNLKVIKGYKNMEFEAIEKQNNLKGLNTIVNEVDYQGIISQKPKLVKNGQLNAHVGCAIIDLIIDIGKSVVISDITNHITNWLKPAEYDYAKEILNKVNEIEQNIEKLSKMTELIAYQEALGKRREQLIGLSTVSNSYFVRYCDALQKGEDVTPIVEEWSTKICVGTNVYYVVENLLKLYLNDSVVLNKSYPAIYDEIGYMAYPWQSRSYGFRQALREEDQYVVLSNLILSQSYFAIQKDEYHLKELERLTADYSKFVQYHYAELSPNPVCQIPGAEVTFDKVWTSIGWTDRLQAAKDNKWNLKDGKIRNKVYYQDVPHKYCTKDVIIALQAYYGGQTLNTCLKDANLYCDSVLISGFQDVPASDYYVVQGRYDWERKMWRKNKDKFIVQAAYMANANNASTNYAQIVCEGCNFTSGIVPPQDYDPPMKCTNVGHAVKSCGMFQITKWGR